MQVKVYDLTYHPNVYHRVNVSERTCYACVVRRDCRAEQRRRRRG
jgi:hypothetical protein